MTCSTVVAVLTLINGGDGNDTIIGGEGDDTIDVGGGFNTIVYNSTNFGADIVNSFDTDGGAVDNQDKIDLSALGITAANLGTRVVESTIGGAGNTLLTIRDAALNTIGTIRINGVTNAQIDASDFTLGDRRRRSRSMAWRPARRRTVRVPPNLSMPMAATTRSTRPAATTLSTVARARMS